MKKRRIFSSCRMESATAKSSLLSKLQQPCEIRSLIRYSCLNTAFIFRHALDSMALREKLTSRSFMAYPAPELERAIQAQAFKFFELVVKIKVEPETGNITNIRSAAVIYPPDGNRISCYGKVELRTHAIVRYYANNPNAYKADDYMVMRCCSHTLDISSALFSVNYLFLGTLAEHLQNRKKNELHKAPLVMQRLLTALSAYYTPRFRNKVRIFDMANIGSVHYE